MAVSVDTVYQRVLAIANKEQRGYITPQEFNLLANKAQLEIFEQYFYDIEQYGRRHGNSTEYSDHIDILAEKISPFEKWKVGMSAVSGNDCTLPTSTTVHKLGTVFFNKSGTTYDVEVERVEKNDLHYMERTALIQPTEDRPVYVRKTNSIIKLFPASPTGGYSISNVTCNYIAKPTDVSWGYNVVLGKAMYNASTSTDFELQASEETTLVNKILFLSGLIVEKPGLAGVAGTMVNEEKQQEKI